MQKVVSDSPMPRPASVTGTPLAGGWSVGLGSIAQRLAAIAAWFERLTDRQLALFIALVLFGMAAWPLALVDLPPLQDLPNHLATVTVIEHPGQYPEFVFNGYFKTNSALFTWLLVAGHAMGIKAAVRLFVLLVLGLGALSYPRLVLSLAGRRAMISSAFFAWPMVHNFFVSMGMLDFALGVPLATFLLVLLEAQSRSPTVARSASIAGLALLTWHAHAFPLLVVHLLVLVHVARCPSWAERATQARALVPPLLPASILVTVSLWNHLTEPVGAMTGDVALGRLLPPWELFYNLWAEWLYAFTWLQIATLVPCLGLGLWAIARWRTDVPLFGPLAFVTLAALYFFSPYVVTNWFNVNSRFIPFLWMAALVRAPQKLPRPARAVLAICAASYSVGLGVDYVRLDRDWARFTAGVSAVPEGSRLLPLLFRGKATSENTRNMLHAWGFYVTRRHTSAPLLFAHSRSFPVMYREPPPPQFNHLVLEGFAPNMGSPDWICHGLRSNGIAPADCVGLWRAQWAEFWTQALPRYDHVLLWSAPKEVLAQIPPPYKVTFARDELTILARQ
jgi:hypothetical protein